MSDSRSQTGPTKTKFIHMVRKPANKNEAQTSEPLQPPPQLELPLKPLPDNAVPQILGKLFDLAIEGNPSAAKLLLDVLDKKYSDAPTRFTVEDALKLIQEHLKKAA